jgi:hypothetical protein
MISRALRSLGFLVVLATTSSIATVAWADPPPAPAAGKKPKAAAPAKPKPAAKPKEASKPATAAATEAPPKPAASGPTSAHEVVEHESRIEFDERMVHGQSAAGAIFLFQRTPSEFKSIVQVPETFRPKTVEMLQPRRGAL